MTWYRVMRDSVAGSEIYQRPNSRSAPASSSHFCGQREGEGKIFKWKLQRQIKLKKWHEQNGQVFDPDGHNIEAVCHEAE